jgi:hypothetical protein
MRPHRQRWLSIPEVLSSMASRYPAFYEKLAPMNRKAQLQAVRRLVQRAERRDAWRFTKRVSGDIYVNVDALEALLPVDVETVAIVAKNLADLHQSHRDLRRRVSGHGSKIRQLNTDVEKVKEKQRLLDQYIQGCAAIDASL